MNRTKIEYVDFTWNPVTGCTKGCEYCYARRLAYGRLRKCYLQGNNRIALRYLTKGMDQQNPFAPRFWPGRDIEPCLVTKPARIFVCDMGDLFDPHVSNYWVETIIQTVRDAHWHTFLFMTKQPQRMAQFEFPDNAWCGITLDGKTRFMVSAFKSVRAKTKFISYEPLLDYDYVPEFVHWVIIGAMTGKGAIKPKAAWVQGLIEQADGWGIPVFLKDNLKWKERRQEFPKEG